MKTYRTTTLKIAAPLVGLALALSACGGGDEAETAAPAPAATVNGISTSFNDTDEAFIKDMSPHHSSAVEMALLAPTRAASAEVKAIAAKIAAAQEPEIMLMEDMATAWEIDLGDGGGHSGMSMGGSMSMGDDVAALEPLTGAAFDKEFLTRMIAHHEGALEMTAPELAQGENPQAKELAQEIADTQTAEIEEMKALLATL